MPSMTAARSVTYWQQQLQAGNQKLGCATVTVERRLRLIRKRWEKELTS